MCHSVAGQEDAIVAPVSEGGAHNSSSSTESPIWKRKKPIRPDAWVAVSQLLLITSCQVGRDESPNVPVMTVCVLTQTLESAHPNNPWAVSRHPQQGLGHTKQHFSQIWITSRKRPTSSPAALFGLSTCDCGWKVLSAAAPTVRDHRALTSRTS